MTEIAGTASSGRTSLLHSLLASASGGQEFCALLDAEDAFDPESAAAAGVRLSQILWVRCGGNVEHALKAADLLTQAGGFGLVAIDLGTSLRKWCEEFLWHPGFDCGAPWNIQERGWWFWHNRSTRIPVPR